MEKDAIAILNMYHDEWKYRHENFWKRLIQFYVVIFFITTLPITFRLFGALTLPDVSLLIFPLIGIALTFLFLFFCLSENGRLVATSRTIERILSDSFGDQFAKADMELFRGEAWNRRVQKIPLFKWRIGTWVPIALSLLQWILAGFVLFLLLTGRITCA